MSGTCLPELLGKLRELAQVKQLTANPRSWLAQGGITLLCSAGALPNLSVQSFQLNSGPQVLGGFTGRTEGGWLPFTQGLPHLLSLLPLTASCWVEKARGHLALVLFSCFCI